jgi:hypothetical protein
MTGPTMASLSATATCLPPVQQPNQPTNGSSLRISQSYGLLPTSERSVIFNPNGVSPSIPRRPSLGTLKANLNQRMPSNLASSSSLLTDSAVNGGPRMSYVGIAENASEMSPKNSHRNLLLAPPSSSTAGRSPKVKRKTNKQGKPKEKKKSSASTKQVKTKTSSTEEWPKFDLSTMLTALASSVPGGDVVCAAIASVSLNCDVKIEDASGDEDAGPAAGNIPAHSEVGEFANQRVESPELYARFASSTRSVGRFNKLAYPDLYGHVVTPFKEPFYEKKFGTQRSDCN